MWDEALRRAFNGLEFDHIIGNRGGAPNGFSTTQLAEKRALPTHAQARLIHSPRQRRVQPGLGDRIDRATIDSSASALLQLRAQTAPPPPPMGRLRSSVPASSQAVRTALARRACAQRVELAEWKGTSKRFYGHRLFANELKFSEQPPYGVIAPQSAANRLGESLRVARRVLAGRELQAADAELTAQPRSLAWGDPTDSEMARSKRKYFDMAEDAKMAACSSADGVARREYLEADLSNAAPREICTPALAERVAAHLSISTVDSPLRAIQVNYQHTNLPQVLPPAFCTLRGVLPDVLSLTCVCHTSSQHHDESDGDGFGRDIATINVRGHADVVICEVDEDEAVTTSWWFSLAPGDVWGMPGDGACGGYVRWACTHGVPLVREPGSECEKGCTACRMSLNFRWGY